MYHTCLDLVVRILDDSAVSSGGGDSDAVGVSTVQAADGAGGGRGVAAGARAVWADGQRSVGVWVTITGLPLHRQSIGTAVQVCLHATGQTGSWEGEEGSVSVSGYKSECKAECVEERKKACTVYSWF